jgi:hypothetical protein
MEDKMKKIPLVVMLVLMIALLPALAEEQKASAAPERVDFEVVTKTYALRFVTPDFIQDSLRIYMRNCSFAKESSLISVALFKKDVADFEEQLRKLDVPKKSILLRIFSVIAAREGKSEAIENKELKRVLAEVSNLLNFKSYVLDGASAITVRDGAEFGRLALSSSISEGLRFDYKGISVLTGAGGKRSVKLGFNLYQVSSKQELLSSETEIAENGFLVAGVSRLGEDGRSLVLVINAEIK